VVWSPEENDRPLTTEATAMPQAEGKEEEARRDFYVVGACHQQGYA